MVKDPDDKLLITVDGPAGAGKTTVTRALSDRLGYKYIDTGALYRGVAFEARAGGISGNDDERLKKLCDSMNLRFVPSEQGLRLFSNSADISDRIRTPEISMLASAVSARPVVRAYLLDLQRELGKEKGAVFEGRDMGTVVFPGADIKFFLTASIGIRARRRYEELKDMGSMTREEVERDIKKRDNDDGSRELAPLKPAADSIEIDSSHLSVQEVVDLMMTHINRRLT